MTGRAATPVSVSVAGTPAPAGVRRVETPHRPRRELPTGVYVVTEDDGTEVVVRLTPDRVDRWRCSGCRLRCTTTDCVHAFAVALHLAETELGLIPKENHR